MTPAEVCSYLRGRLDAYRVEHVEGDRYRVVGRRLDGEGRRQEAVASLAGICRQYGIAPEKLKTR